MLLSAEDVEVASSAWTWLGPLVGVVAGGVLGGAAQLLVESRRDRNGRRATLMGVRRDIYFDALAVVDGMRITLDDFMSAASGQPSPEECETEEELEEARRRDAEGAAAVGRLLQDRRAVHGVVIKVGAVGSPAVRKAVEDLGEAVDDYMNEVIRQATTDGIFRGAVAEAFKSQYATLSDALSRAIRNDLQVDRIINEKI